MSSYELPTNVNPADIRLSHTCTCGLSHRIAAFGAIRRAAELAREYDRAAFDANGRRPQVYDDCVFAANTIRETIRTALESPKA